MKVGDLVTMPMKVGDLVTMPDPHVETSVGLVVDVNTACRTPGLERVGVIWADSDRVDYEPKNWLEVISESR